MKKAIAILFTVILIFSLTGCAESKATLYDKATKLYASGQYEAAAEIFESLGDYQSSRYMLSSAHFYTCINQKIYTDAVAAFEKRNFDEALVFFETMPEDFGLKNLVIGMISAYKNCETGKWLDAAFEFEQLYDQEKQFKNKKTIDIDWLLTPAQGLIIPLDVELDSWFSGCGYRKMDRLRYDCFYQYYKEQYRQGDNLFTLSEYPLEKWPMETTVNYRWNEYLEISLNKIIRQQGVEDYYTKTDMLVSSVNITGNGVLLKMELGQIENIGSKDIRKTIPPFYLAETLEDTRYILFIEATHEYDGTYSFDNRVTTGKAYKTTTIVTLKDVLSNEIVFEDSSTKNPPKTITKGDDGYGDIDSELIKSALAKVIPDFS